MTDQEEFAKLVKKLYALADKMGQRLTITVRSIPVPKKQATAGKPAVATPSQRREPGED
jgi:hypothetical protein